MLAIEVTFNLRNNGTYRILASRIGLLGNTTWPHTLTGIDFSSQIILTPDNGSFVYSNRGITSDAMFNISKPGDPNNYVLLSFTLRPSEGVQISVSGHDPITDKQEDPTFNQSYHIYKYGTYNTISVTTRDGNQYNFGCSIPSIYSDDLIKVSCDFL